MQTELSMAAAGGALIGFAAVTLLLLAGRVAGISGILWGALKSSRSDAWRWLFLVGMLVGGAAAHTLGGVPVPSANPLPWPFAVIAGLLVGYGVKVGNGCTSGHGVCGIGFQSRRSIIATLTFMSTGVLTVFVVRHLLGVGT